MSIFCENSFALKKDVSGMYRKVDSFFLEEFDDGLNPDDELIKKDDFDKCLNQIEDDIKNIIKIIKSLAVDEAVGELSVLLEKLY